MEPDFNEHIQSCQTAERRFHGPSIIEGVRFFKRSNHLFAPNNSTQVTPPHLFLHSTPPFPPLPCWVVVLFGVLSGSEANTAREAASALCRLLLGKPTEALRELKPRVNAEAVTAALRRHPTDGLVQWHGCWTLQLLCKRFPELRGQLQRDPTVLTTVQAAPGAVRLEKCNWYRELCGWLQLCLGTALWTDIVNLKCQKKSKSCHFSNVTSQP